MKKHYIFLMLGLSVFLVVAFFLLFQNALAWPGCCSKHKGVCGCECCDGSPLSNTCAPHYPSCPLSKDTIVDPPPNYDRQFQDKINLEKKDYSENHDGFREKLIEEIAQQFGNGIALDKIGYFVYTMLPDIKDESELYKVQRVIDGDTIAVNINGKNESLRLIGIDTPETVDPRKSVQCFGREASDKAKEILSDKMVRLESDSTQSDRDKYQRLLRYVFLEDGTLFNKLMVEEGYAHEYTYQSNPYKYQAEFMEAEKQARENSRGLWSPDTCNGDTTK